MSYRRTLGAAIGIFLVAIAVPALARVDESTEVDVRIAKTAKYVRPFGTIEPAQPRARVSVRLFRFKDERWVRIDEKRVDVASAGDTDGDGISESSYRARFSRPLTGSCRAVAVLKDSGSRGTEEFPCGIPDFPNGTARMTSLTDEVEIRALIAETDEHRQYGLMYRPRLPNDLGMAFLWESDTSGGFWMKNTLIPLSIAFFDDAGVIVKIMHMEPCVEDPCEVYDPGVSYRGALEVNQGAFDQWDIAEGDRIEIER